MARRAGRLLLQAGKARHSSRRPPRPTVNLSAAAAAVEGRQLGRVDAWGAKEGQRCMYLGVAVVCWRCCTQATYGWGCVPLEK